MRRRLNLAWRVLRGQAVMYRCALMLDDEGCRILVGVARPGLAISAVENVASTNLPEGSGELYVFDCRQGLTYPLHFEGRAP